MDSQSPGCFLRPSQRSKNFRNPTRKERFDLGLLGVTDSSRIRIIKIAYILGIHFKAGEWGKTRCGSVITTIYGGRSRYESFATHVLYYIFVSCSYTLLTQ